MGRGGGFQPTKRDTVSHEIWGMGEPKKPECVVPPTKSEKATKMKLETE